MDRKSAPELQEHMLWTYYGVRVGLAVIGISLPLIVLFAGGVLHHVWLEPSISRYYYTQGLPFLTTRDLFVGGLLAIGACLYLYKGFSNKENIALNLAGVFAAGVALFPTADTPDHRGFASTLHAGSAVLFFICIAYVSLFRSQDTLRLLPESLRASYARRYFWTGLALIASPLAAVFLSFALEPTSRFRTIVFWLESLAVWAFAAFWIVKTLEMRESDAEKRALNAELERRPVRETLAKPAGRSIEVERVVPAAGTPRI
jgi:hypothetical protein